MSLILKDPQAMLDYEIDWGADYLGHDALALSEWTVEPQHEGGVEVATMRHTPDVAHVTAEGGQPGLVYRLTNRIETIEGRTDVRSILLRVEAR